MGGYKTQRDITKFVSVSLLLLIVAVLILPQIVPLPAQAEIPPTWNDTDWDFRRVIKLTENSGTQMASYPVKVVLNQSSFNYSRVKGSNGDDLRFITSSGTNCSYWIQDWNTSGTSTVWLKVPSIPASGTTNVYMYYGNSAASAVSSGTDTFTFFDDFPGSSIDTDKWDGDTSEGSVADSILTYNIGGTAKVIYTDTTYGQGYSVISRLQWPDSTEDTIGSGFGFWTYPGTDAQRAHFVDTTFFGLTNCLITRTDDDPLQQEVLTNQSQWVADSYATWEIRRNSSTNVEFYIDSIECDDSPMNTWVPDQAMPIELNATNKTVYVDWVLVREYISSEPTVALGAEETTTTWYDIFGGDGSISSSTNITASGGGAELTDTSTEILRPVGAGSSTAEGAIKYQTPDDAGAHWEKVDEASADDATTMIYQAFSSEDQVWRGDLFTTEDHVAGSGTISSATVHFRVRRSVASGLDAWARPVIQTHDTQYNGTTVTITPFNTWTNYSQTWTTNPNTGDPWTWEEIDALQIGVGLRMDYVGFPWYTASRSECTQVYVEVEYTHTGEVVSAAIEPSSLSNWDIFAWDDTEPTNTDIKCQLEYYDGDSWQLIPDGDLSGNSAGFDTSPVDLMGLDASTYTQLRFKASFTTSEESVTPTLHDWHITWNDWTDGEIAWDKVGSSSNVTVGDEDITLNLSTTTETFRPSASGSETGINAQNPSTGEHWDKVDESSSDDWTTYVQKSGNWGSWGDDVYNIPDHGAIDGLITKITIYFTVLRSDHFVDPVGRARSNVRIGGTTYNGSSLTISAVGSWEDRSQEWTTNPSTSQPWTWDDIDELQIGVGLQNNTAQFFFTTYYGVVYCTQLYMIVTYIPVGEVTSTAITASGTITWDTFTANHGTPSGTSMTYKILDASDDSVLCTISGTDAATGHDISSCAGSTNPVKAYAELSTTADDQAPTLNDWQLTWQEPLDLTLNSVVLWNTGSPPAEATSITPQVEHNAKVKVTLNDGTLNDLDTITSTIFYDSDGTYNVVDVPSSGTTETAAILTWTNGGSPAWTIDPSASTTWSVNSGSSSAPSLGGTTGTFEFYFTPGKVATETTGSAKWHIYAIANSGSDTADNYQENLDMNWYGEVSSVTASFNFGSVSLGDTDIVSSGSVTATYISNGAYDEQVKSDANWVGQSTSTNIALDTGGSPGSAEFSLKADDDNTVDGAVQVLSASYTAIDTSGTQTAEAGVTQSNNFLWLSTGSDDIPVEEYQGSVYFGIGDGS